MERGKKKFFWQQLEMRSCIAFTWLNVFQEYRYCVLLAMIVSGVNAHFEKNSLVSACSRLIVTVVQSLYLSFCPVTLQFPSLKRWSLLTHLLPLDLAMWLALIYEVLAAVIKGEALKSAVVFPRVLLDPWHHHKNLLRLAYWRDGRGIQAKAGPGQVTHGLVNKSKC